LFKQKVKSTFWTSSIKWENPDDCEWSVYEGPLFIDLRLPVEWSVPDDRRGTPVGPQEAVIGDIGPLATGNIVEAMQLCLAGGDDGYETGAEVLRLAFPRLHDAMERFYGDGGPLVGETAIPEGELRNVLRAELHRFFRGTWRRAQLAKKTDAISKLAREMDMPVQLARKYEAMAREHVANQPDEQNTPEAMRALDSPLFHVSNHHTVGLRSTAGLRWRST
jgi:hypothetical protein